MAKGKKTGGRGAGTPNIVTKEIKEILKNILEIEVTQIPVYLEGLKPEQRLDFITRLLPFVIPKLAHSKQEVDGRISGSISDLMLPDYLSKG